MGVSFVSIADGVYAKLDFKVLAAAEANVISAVSLKAAIKAAIKASLSAEFAADATVNFEVKGIKLHFTLKKN